MRKRQGRFLVLILLGSLLVSCVTAQVGHMPNDFQPILPGFCDMKTYIAYKEVFKASREHGPMVWVYLEKELASEFRWIFEKDMPEEERKALKIQADRVMEFYEYTCRNARMLDMMTFPEYQQNVCGGAK